MIYFNFIYLNILFMNLKLIKIKNSTVTKCPTIYGNVLYHEYDMYVS